MSGYVNDIRYLEKQFPKKYAILEMLALGMSTREIAKALGVTIRTIRVHIQDMRTWFDAKNITNLVYLAVKEGVL